ncbi:MAG: hypothetical protein M9894_19785 [Planctomycetes bacterium]|nr:hypothetical protein [Planctomycetota bacterium]
MSGGRGVRAALLVLLAAGAAAAQEEPDLAALRERGRRTAARLEVAPAAWTSFHAVGPEYLVFEVLQAPPRRRVDVFVERAGERRHALTILERDGRWLVAEGDGGGAYRPFEAPLEVPHVYEHLARALRPRTADALPEDPGERLGVERGVATWRRDVTEAEIRAFSGVIEELKRRVDERPALRQDPTFRERLRWADRLEREYLEGGLTRVQVESGLVVQHGAPGRRSALAGFRWLEQVDEARFAAEGEPPVDASAAPSGPLLMFAHCPWWQPGVPPEGVILDARLLEVASGRVRRVPVQGGSALPGAFSRDRRRAFVLDGGLVEVDLVTGKNRRLAPSTLASGDVSSSALSPDGRTLAVLHHPRGGAKGQVHLVDLEAGTSRALGAPLLGAGLAWLPGGEGLALVARDAPDAPEQVAVLEPSGRLRALRAGSGPLPLPGGRLLFLDVASGLWSTCDLVGGAAQPFLGGLPGLRAPALSPDGERLAFAAADGSGLVLVDVATGRRERLDLGPGLFGSPVWR